MCLHYLHLTAHTHQTTHIVIDIPPSAVTAAVPSADASALGSCLIRGDVSIREHLVAGVDVPVTTMAASFVLIVTLNDSSETS